MGLPALQPLRIPAGWMIEYNDLREADPSPQSFDAQVLREDLLQLKHSMTGVLVDVGWYGDAELGEFAIHVHRGDFSGERLHEFRSRDRHALVAEIERLLSPGATGLCVFGLGS